MIENAKKNVLLYVILFVGLLLRLTTAIYFPLTFRFRSDAVRYVLIAKNILNFHTFGVKPNLPIYTTPPGYPLFLAGVFSITGQKLMAVRIVQVIMGTLMIYLVYLIGKKIWNRRVGLVAAFILSFYPVWIIWPSLFLTETLFTLLLLLFVFFFIRYLKNKSGSDAALAGFSFSLSLLVRETPLLILPALPLVLLWARVSWKRLLVFLGIFTVILGIVITPWMFRNYEDFGEMFYTKRTRLSRYFHHVSKTGVSVKHHKSPYIPATTPENLKVKGPAFYAYYGTPKDMYSMSRILSDPGLFLIRILRRLKRIWLHPKGLDSVPDKWNLREIYILFNAVILFLAVLGLIVGFRKRTKKGFEVIVATIFCVTITVLIFTIPHPRYVLPIQPLIFVLTAIGLEIFSRIFGIMKKKF